MIRVVVKSRSNRRELILFKDSMFVREILEEVSVKYDCVVVMRRGKLVTPDEIIHSGDTVEIVLVYEE